MKLAALCIAALALGGCAASSIRDVDTSRAQPECVRQCAATYSSCVTGSISTPTKQACYDAFQVCIDTCPAKAAARGPLVDEGAPARSPDPASAQQGKAARESGASGNYPGRVRAAIRPNVTYPDVDTVKGNPAAEFEVNLAPDGTIVGVKLRTSSGVPGWDEAAERAIRRTDKLPRDTDGRVYTPMTIMLRPKD